MSKGQGRHSGHARERGPAETIKCRRSRCPSRCRSARRRTPTSATSSRTAVPSRRRRPRRTSCSRSRSRRSLDSLSGRERRVLQLRFGLEDGRPRTLEEVGKEFNVTASGSARSRRRRCASCATRREPQAQGLPRGEPGRAGHHPRTSAGASGLTSGRPWCCRGAPTSRAATALVINGMTTAAQAGASVEHGAEDPAAYRGRRGHHAQEYGCSVSVPRPRPPVSDVWGEEHGPATVLTTMAYSTRIDATPRCVEFVIDRCHVTPCGTVSTGTCAFQIRSFALVRALAHSLLEPCPRDPAYSVQLGRLGIAPRGT